MYFAPAIRHSLTVLFFCLFFVLKKIDEKFYDYVYWIFIGKTQAAVPERHLHTGPRAGMWNVVKITQQTWRNWDVNVLASMINIVFCENL